jgi:ribosomal protein L37AE/L43A
MSDGKITCCPECGHSDVQVLARLNYNWRCQDDECGAVFEEPDRREPENNKGTAPTKGSIAHELWEADKPEVTHQ